jgi:hypothetical protein
MLFRVCVEQPPDHPLVLCMMLPSLTFEKLDTALAQGKGDFDGFIPKDEVLRSRQEVRNDLEVSEGFVCVFDFLAHKFASLFASSRLQKSE